jgi:hypothetical protein
MPNISAGEGSFFAFFDPAAFLPFGDFALGDLDGGGAGAFLCGPNEARLTDLAAKAFFIGVASALLAGVFFAGDFTASAFLTGVFLAGDFAAFATAFLAGIFLLVFKDKSFF